MSHGNTLLGSVRKVSSTGHPCTILNSAVALLPNLGTVQLETAPRRTTCEEKKGREQFERVEVPNDSLKGVPPILGSTLEKASLRVYLGLVDAAQ